MKTILDFIAGTIGFVLMTMLSIYFGLILPIQIIVWVVRNFT